MNHRALLLLVVLATPAMVEPPPFGPTDQIVSPSPDFTGRYRGCTFESGSSVDCDPQPPDYWPPSWSSPVCSCIRNVNGACMTLSRRGMPRYSRGSGTQNQFLPTCVDDCLPGSTLTSGPDPQTQRELRQCYVDWKRLKRLNPQWNDPNWSP
jgi:hypothetical protein